MPQIIDIPDVGEVEFPDEMSDDAITRASKRLHLQAGMDAARKEGKFTEAMERGISRDVAWADFVLRPFASTPENPLGAFGTVGQQAGAVVNEAGKTAKDVYKGVAGSYGVTTGRIDEKIVETLPMVAASMFTEGALSPVIANPAVRSATAFGAVPAAATLDATGDTPTAVKAGIVGALVPGVAQAGREAAAVALGKAVNAGALEAGANTTQKIAEAFAAQGAVQVFMEGMNLPEYVAMDPAQRREALLDNLAVNTAFLAMDVPGISRKTQPSHTRERFSETVKAGEIMERLVNDPAAADALRIAADDFALQATDPRRAQRRVVELADEPAQLQEGTVGRDSVEPTMDRRSLTIEATTPPEAPPVEAAPEATPAAPQVPVKSKARRISIAPSPDGIPDVLDTIADLGGIKAPGDQKAGGEYDGYAEGFGFGPARILRGGSERPDLLLQALNHQGFHFETVDDMYAAVRAASERRVKLASTAKEQRVVRETIRRQVTNMHAEALEGKMPTVDELYSLELSMSPKELDEFDRMLVKLRTMAEEAEVDPENIPFDPAPVNETLEPIRSEAPTRSEPTAPPAAANLGATAPETVLTTYVTVRGRDFYGPIHSMALGKAEVFFDERLELSDVSKEGFVSSTGRKINREEAARIAVNAGQADPGNIYKGRLHAGEVDVDLAEDANAALQSGVAGIKTPSETQSRGQRGFLRTGPAEAEPAPTFAGAPQTQAGKGNISALQKEEAIALTGQNRPQALGDVNALNAPTTPPPGSPGTAVLFNARLPVTLPRAAPGAVSIPQVMKSLEAVITAAGGQTPIRVGRFNKKRARGVYDPRTEVARINSADNIPTATHEIGHASQKLLYGSAYARGLKGLPPPVKAELVKLGRALYGSTRPAAGYSGEGWAEFIRTYVTTDDAARLAPATEKYFREKVLVDHPEFARAIGDARKLVDVYRAQGSVGRAQQQLVKAPGKLQRIVKTIKDSISMRAQVDEFEPLWKLSQGYKERSGNVLEPAADPFLLASWKRGTAGAVVETMVNDAMIDPWGNPLLGPGNVSLKQALAPVKGRGDDFALYLFGRRALERWKQNKNPGLTKEDAQYLVNHFDSPAFQLAARQYYSWHEGLLDYVRAADPAMGPTLDAIQAASSDYAPLARVIDPSGSNPAAAATRSNPLQRMHGSGRQVRDIFETTIENAARLVSHAHRKMVLESIVKLSKKEGMGFLVEEVPRSQVKTEVNFEKLRQQLEDIGVDTSMVNPDEILAFFDLADQPKGADPIVAVKEADGLHWYHVSPDVFELLNGLKAPSLAEIPHVGKALDLVLGAPARAFRLGTTGLRASFSLFTNPVRDLRTFIMQTQSHANPARLASSYFSALGEVVRAGLGGKKGPHVEAFTRLGAQLGQPLGIDIQHTKRAAKGLFHGKLMRVATNPIDHLRDILQITESAPRVAELKLIAEEAGWKPGQTMTPDQAVQIALAAKRVTVDFSAGGRTAKMINQAVPFYNATIQGTRSFARAVRDNPARAVLYGLATFTVPALLNWWRNKDEEWYRWLPWRERYLYDNIQQDDGSVLQIPRPPEWGNFFSVVPEALMDSWYRQDPKGAGEAMKHLLATTVPLDFPVPLKIAKEQWQNRIDFFDRPIVPRNQIDLPPGEQRGPYTTKLGEWIGNAFPEHASPRRIDAAVRGYFGGVVPDVLDAIGAGSRKRDREEEKSDLPVLGRAFRRGGEISAANLPIGDYYDDLTRYSARIAAEDLARKEGREPLNPLDPREYAYGKLLEAMRPVFKLSAQLADETESLAARQSLYRDMAREAERLSKLRPKVD